MERAPIAADTAFDLPDLPLPDLLEINALADNFEAAWQAGRDPSVSDFEDQLRTCSAAAHATLRVHLTQLHAELRSGRKTARGSLHDDEWGMSESIVVGEYRILERLGCGGMGVVYKALHRRLDRVVAIKFPRFATQLDPVSAERFVREARLLGRLVHPHLVPAIDAGDSDYGPYLVTEFVAGETIEALVRREGPLPLGFAMSLTAQAASALAYSHSHGIIHRDVKPSNLYLGSDRALRVLDFGLAKLQLDDRSLEEERQMAGATQAGTFLGTVGYAAPEQLRGTEGVDHRADIYALGCAFYFMLTGETPHAGNLKNRLNEPRKQIRRALRRRRPDVPSAVISTWRRMVAAAPERRIESMAEVETAMRQTLPTMIAAGHLRPLASTKLLRRALSVSALAMMAACAIALATLGPSARRGEPSTPPPAAAVAPFDQHQAQRHQQRWAAHLHTDVRHVNPIGMSLVLIPPGEYIMGKSDDPVPDVPPNSRRRVRHDAETSQRPQHRVVLSRPFYLGESEVTVGQFRQFVDGTRYVTEAERRSGWGIEDGVWVERTGYSWKNLGQWRTDDRYPVNNVTWGDAVAFCDWLTSRCSEGTYRLPTEAEWEFACRAGTTTTFYFGNDADRLPEHAWTLSNSLGFYWSAALKQANPFGLYDMYGNRREWCLDNFSSDFYSTSPVVDPVNVSSGLDRVMRGGGHADPAAFATSAYRWVQSCSITNHAGFRVVLETR